MNEYAWQPPTLNGVGASKVFLPKHVQAATVFEFLCAQFSHIMVQEWHDRFEQGLILNAQGQTLQINDVYVGNRHIYYYRALPAEVEVPFAHQILFEDEHLLVVDKPHFLTISPTGQYVQQTLLVRLKQQTGLNDLTPIHRLDRETAGLVLFCKTPALRGAYQQLFAQRQVQKTYHAIAEYRPELQFPCDVALYMEKAEPFFTMRINPKRPPNSFSQIELLMHDHLFAKYQLTPSTGKQHQLRVHMAALGIAIRHDPLYPTIQFKAAQDWTNPLQLLAKTLAFWDPVQQQQHHFKSQFELYL